MRLKPIRLRAAFVTAALALWVLIALLTLAVCVQRISLVNDFLLSRSADGLNALKTSDDDLEIAFDLQAIFVLVTAVAFLAWMTQARVNSDAIGLYRSRWSRRWIFLGWLIPGMNFWIPLRIVSDLWRGSDPSLRRDSLPRPGLVVAWWIAWLGYYFIARFATSMTTTGPEVAGQIRTLTFVEMASVSVGIVAALLAMTVVWLISLLPHPRAAVTTFGHDHQRAGL